MQTTWDEQFPGNKIALPARHAGLADAYQRGDEAAVRAASEKLGLHSGETLEIDGQAASLHIAATGSKLAFEGADLEELATRLRKKWGTPFEEKAQILWLGEGWRAGLRAGTGAEENWIYLEIVPYTSMLETLKKLMTRTMPTVGSKRTEVLALPGAEDHGATISVSIGPTEVSDASTGASMTYELDGKGIVARVGVITNMKATSKTMEDLVRLSFTGKPMKKGKHTVYIALGLTCEVSPTMAWVQRA